MPSSFKPQIKKSHRTPQNTSPRVIIHDLFNVLSSIRCPCENFVLDAEEGLNKDKTDKENLDNALNIMRKAIKSVEKASGLMGTLSKIAKNPHKKT